MAEFDIMFGVAKFSHAVGPSQSTSIEWKHVDVGDIIVAVTGDDRRNGLLYMRVTREAQTLESVNIAEYIDMADQAQSASGRAGSPLRIDELPIFGISKEILLGVRYKVNGMTRRLQLRMHSAMDCRHLVEVFQRRGMQIQDQRPSTARPGTAGARPLTACSDYRLFTAQPSSPHVRHPQSVTAHSPFRLPDMQVGSLSQHRSSQGDHQFGMSSQQAISATRAPGPDQSSTQNTIVALGPATPQPSRAPVLPHEQQNPPAFSSQQTNRSTAGSGSTLVERIDTKRQPSENAGPSAHNDAETLVGSNYLSPGILRSRVPALWSSDSAEARPNSAISNISATSPMPETLEHEIPPRRELPFKRPASRKSDSNSVSSRPGSRLGSSALSLPPLKIHKPSNDVCSPRKPDNGIPEQQVQLPNSHAELEAEQEASAMNSARTNASKDRVCTPAVASYASEAPVRDVIPMQELLFRKGKAQIPRVSSLMDAPHEIESPPETIDVRGDRAGNGCPASPTPVAIVKPNDPAGVKVASSTNDQTLLRRYEEQDLPDRQAALEDFMMKKLQDPAFTTLCEDVENCWRRIALGL